VEGTSVSESFSIGRASETSAETYVVVHEARALNKGRSYVGELGSVDIGAVVLDVSAIIDVPVLVDVADGLGPVIGLFGPEGIGAIARVTSQTSSDVEEDAVGNRVFVIVSVVGEGNLPSETAVAVDCIPPGGLRVEDGLGEGKPLRFAADRVLEVDLGSQHGRHAPEALVVIPQGRGPVRRHKTVLRRARLENHGALGQVVVRRVARVVPVIDHGPPHGTCLPPVVRPCGRGSWQDTWCLSGIIAVVVTEEIRGDRLARLFYRVWEAGDVSNVFKAASIGRLGRSAIQPVDEALEFTVASEGSPTLEPGRQDWAQENRLLTRRGQIDL
jgi:hypothetical protein